MATRGREVLLGRLFYRPKKGNGGQKKKKVVGAFAGIGGSSSAEAGSKNVSAQILIFDDYEKVEKPGYKPKNSIRLENAKIDSSYTSPSGSSTSSPAYSSATITSPQGNIRLSASPSPSTSVSSQGNGSSELYPFSVTTSNGDLHEFKTESENDRLRWVKLLQLLVMYPFSPIPEEPKSNPVKDSFRKSLEAKKYGASSVWPVYILPEEVGSKSGILGLHILALRSGIPNVSMGQLDIISPTDPSHPVVTWDRDKMRRTGKTGHLVFIEIGRRCEGGPGLVWMYTGYQNDAQALRETLHKFLFHGDGSAVTMNTQPQSLYDVPRSSVDSHAPSHASHSSASSSIHKRSVPSGYHNHNLTRSRSQDHDSGYHSIGSNGKTPPLLDGPPVRLDKHPSIRRKRDSEPCVIRRSSSSTVQSSGSPQNGSYSERGEISEQLFECDRDEPSRAPSSNSPPDNESEGYATGPMDGDSESNRHLYDVVRDRSNSHPYFTPHAVEGGVAVPLPTTGGDEYMAMVHPKYRQQEGYVVMRPTSQSLSPPQQQQQQHSSAIPVPMPQAGGNSSDEYNTLQHFTGSGSGGRPSSRLNPGSLTYETLPTINERRDNYENHPLPQDLKGVVPRLYRPSYENHGAEFRTGTGRRESYENITVDS